MVVGRLAAKIARKQFCFVAEKKSRNIILVDFTNEANQPEEAKPFS